jgi:hypothetical protein
MTCAICMTFRIPEQLVLMREEKDVDRFDPIPFYVHVHTDCRDEYQHDRDRRPNRIAEQIYPYARRTWAAPA